MGSEAATEGRGGEGGTAAKQVRAGALFVLGSLFLCTGLKVGRVVPNPPLTRERRGTRSRCVRWSANGRLGTAVPTQGREATRGSTRCCPYLFARERIGSRRSYACLSANGRLGTAVPTSEGGAFEGTRGHGDTGTRGLSEGRRELLRGRLGPGRSSFLVPCFCVAASR